MNQKRRVRGCIALDREDRCRDGRGVIGRRCQVDGYRQTWTVAEAGGTWLHLRSFPRRPGDPGQTFTRAQVRFLKRNYT